MTCGSLEPTAYSTFQRGQGIKRKRQAKNQRVKKNPTKETFIAHRG
jgi:hypothetical protein